MRFAHRPGLGNCSHTDQLLEQLREQGLIRAIDMVFAQQIARKIEVSGVRHNEKNTLLVFVSALLSKQLASQHTCLEIGQLGQPFAPIYHFPDVNEVITCLNNSPLVAKVDNLDKLPHLPLVFEKQKLYLQRYWYYEQQVAKDIQRLLTSNAAPDAALVKPLIENLYGAFDKGNSEPDWQKLAVLLAGYKGLAFVTGGPGTGKTTTVVRILWLIVQLLERPRLVINLVAPTGKAVARLLESVNSALQGLPGVVAEQQDVALFGRKLEIQASTVHRCLGVIPGSRFFKHNQQNPLHCDVLVVDEASMIDLPLLAKLLQAVPNQCKVVVLGDKNQLASVDVGSVLADLCFAKQETPGFSNEFCQWLESVSGMQLPNEGAVKDCPAITDAIVELKKSYRFDDNSGIGKLAKLVNSGAEVQALELLQKHVRQPVDVIGEGAPASSLNWFPRYTHQSLMSQLSNHLVKYFSAVASGDTSNAFAVLRNTQVLCVTNQGEWGNQNLNQLVEHFVQSQGWAEPGHLLYPGKPIMVLENDNQRQIYNGDIGIVLPHPETQNVLLVWFEAADGDYRSFLPSQLPPFQSVYALTTHKSQGSEYKSVIMCIPPANSALSQNLLSRELLYTGITRAKEQFTLFAPELAVKSAIKRQCQRASGLADRLG